MKRGWEVLAVLAVVAALGALGLLRAHRPGPPPATPTASTAGPGVWDPKGPPLTFNYLKPGDTVKQAEQRYGPPTFSNPSAHFQQWEEPLTQVTYDNDGVLVIVEGSGLGVIRQGDRVLFRCGQPEQDIEKVFGKPLMVADLFYCYPGFKLHCGSQQGNQRWVSAVVLGYQEGR